MHILLVDGNLSWALKYCEGLNTEKYYKHLNVTDEDQRPQLKDGEFLKEKWIQDMSFPSVSVVL